MSVKKDCPCPKKECPRNGNCEECRANHSAQGNLPACEREKQGS